MRTCIHNNTHVYLFGEFKRPKYVAPNIAGPNSFQCSIYLAGSIPQQRFGISNISISCWNGIGPAGKKTCKYPREKNILFKSGFHKVGPSFQFKFEFGSNHEQSFLGDQKFGCPKQAASIPQSLAQTLHSPSWDPPGSKWAASQGEMPETDVKPLFGGLLELEVPPNHPKLDFLSIETHGFGDPPF